jgi:phospholipase/lecithinase/hemolysin
MHKLTRWMLLAFTFASASLAQAQGCNNRFVAFGDSLTDPGNAYAALGVISTAPFSLIPSAPYASHTFSNGPTWAQRLANSLDSPDSGAPAFTGPGTFTNYAVGGARARPGTGSYDLTAEVSLFLSTYGGHACPQPTYVLWIGGDDLRDALTAIATAPDPASGQAAAQVIIGAAVTSIADNVVALAGSGARNFLILNAPDISHAPAVRIFGPPAITAGAVLSAAFNDALGGAIAQLRGLPQVHIARYDDNVLIAAIIASPGEFELSDVVDTCLRFGVVQNAVCEEPSDFLFWDGVHPTAAGHRIVARAVRANAFANTEN